MGIKASASSAAMAVLFAAGAAANFVFLSLHSWLHSGAFLVFAAIAGAIRIELLVRIADCPSCVRCLCHVSCKRLALELDFSESSAIGVLCGTILLCAGFGTLYVHMNLPETKGLSLTEVQAKLQGKSLLLVGRSNGRDDAPCHEGMTASVAPLCRCLKKNMLDLHLMWLASNLLNACGCAAGEGEPLQAGKQLSWVRNAYEQVRQHFSRASNSYVRFIEL